MFSRIEIRNQNKQNKEEKKKEIKIKFLLNNLLHRLQSINCRLNKMFVVISISVSCSFLIKSKKTVDNKSFKQQVFYFHFFFVFLISCTFWLF